MPGERVGAARCKEDGHGGLVRICWRRPGDAAERSSTDRCALAELGIWSGGGRQASPGLVPDTTDGGLLADMLLPLPLAPGSE